MDRDEPSKVELRAVLREVADVIADLVLERRGSIRVDSSGDESERPVRPTAPARRRRAPRMPPIVDTTLEISDANRVRARQALLRRGYNVKERADG